MATGGEEQKQEPVSIKLMTLNPGEKGQNQKNENGKFGVIAALLKHNSPDIIFLQQIPCPGDLRKGKWLPLDSANYDQQVTGEEAAVVWNKHKFEMVKTDQIEIFENAEKKYKSEDISEVKGKSCIVLLESQTTGNYLLAASYHGYNNKRTVQGKINMLKAFQGYLTMIGKKYTHKNKPTSIIIGGDFNLDLKKAITINDFSKHATYTKTDRRSELELIDYFLYTSTLKVQDVQALELKQGKDNFVFHGVDTAEKSTQDHLYTLDHDPVVATLSYTNIETTSNEEAEYKPGTSRVTVDIKTDYKSETSGVTIDIKTECKPGTSQFTADIKTEYTSGTSQVTADIKTEYKPGTSQYTADIKTEDTPGTSQDKADIKTEYKPGTSQVTADIKTEDKSGTSQDTADIKTEDKPGTSQDKADIKTEDKPGTSQDTADIKTEDKPTLPVITFENILSLKSLPVAVDYREALKKQIPSQFTNIRIGDLNREKVECIRLLFFLNKINNKH